MASHHLLTNSKASGSLSTLLLMPEDETPESGAPRAHQISGVGGIESGEAVGTPAVYETAREEWVIEGYKRALVRFRSATQNREDPNLPRETFIPLFEALDLAASLIERIPDSGLTRTMRAVRYARNRVHHQWALALRGRDVPQPGVLRAGSGSRLMPPTVVFDWFWKPFKELPPPGKKWPDWKGRAAYVDLLEGEPVRVVLEEIEQTF